MSSYQREAVREEREQIGGIDSLGGIERVRHRREQHHEEANPRTNVKICINSYDRKGEREEEKYQSFRSFWKIDR